MIKLNDEISKIKQGLLRDIANSTNQITDFLQNEKNNLSKYFSSVENFIATNKESLQGITNNLAVLAKNSTSETKGIFEREKEIINNFYNINSGLISKSGDEFRETLVNFNYKLENVVSDAKTAFNNLSNSLKNGVKNSTTMSNEVFEHEKAIIEKFYKINSDLIAQSHEEFRSIFKNYNSIIGEESERLKRLSANQPSPAEQVQKMIKTNDTLITHLENIDKTLKTILLKNGSLGNGGEIKYSFYKRIMVGWQRLFNRTTS